MNENDWSDLTITTALEIFVRREDILASTFNAEHGFWVISFNENSIPTRMNKSMAIGFIVGMNFAIGNNLGSK